MLERNQAAIQRQLAAQQALEAAAQQQQQAAEGGQPDGVGQQAAGTVSDSSSSGNDGSSSSSSSDIHSGVNNTVLPTPATSPQQQQQQQRSSRDEPRPFVAAQRYIANPLLIQGRKFGLRLWCVVMGGPPVRAYLHQLGLVLFSQEEYTLEGVRSPDGMVAPVR
jgi:hypothetical protein